MKQQQRIVITGLETSKFSSGKATHTVKMKIKEELLKICDR